MLRCLRFIYILCVIGNCCVISIVFCHQEAAWFCCDEAIQVLGGMGYMKVRWVERSRDNRETGGKGWNQ